MDSNLSVFKILNLPLSIGLNLDALFLGHYIALINKYIER